MPVLEHKNQLFHVSKLNYCILNVLEFSSKLMTFEYINDFLEKDNSLTEYCRLGIEKYFTLVHPITFYVYCLADNVH